MMIARNSALWRKVEDGYPPLVLKRNPVGFGGLGLATAEPLLKENPFGFLLDMAVL